MESSIVRNIVELIPNLSPKTVKSLNTLHTMWQEANEKLERIEESQNKHCLVTWISCYSMLYLENYYLKTTIEDFMRELQYVCEEIESNQQNKIEDRLASFNYCVNHKRHFEFNIIAGSTFSSSSYSSIAVSESQRVAHTNFLRVLNDLNFEVE